MENLDSLNSILPFLPIASSSTSSSYNLSWTKRIVETLKSLSEGPDHSGVDSGEALFHKISNLRNSLDFPSSELFSSTEQGYTLFFDELMSRVESRKWFRETVPALATLLLKLPSLLEAHYRDADEIHLGAKEGYPKIRTALRMLNPQESGIVFLSQELIGGLLACSFFCLFPTVDRRAKLLERINFDFLFASLHFSYQPNQEHKVRCLLHYFERISACMPKYWVSFERKVIPWAAESSPFGVSYPEAEFWSKSTISLCQFEEEIRFMINPELIVGMLFLPCMDANEAIEIVGTERFSNYTGYGSRFGFSGEYTDMKLIDCMGRRKTRIIAIDASAGLKEKQFRVENLVREVNKAWCGFFDQIKYENYQKCLHEDDTILKPSFSVGLHAGENEAQLVGNSHDELCHRDSNVKDDIGIATGNWGCGDFGGDPELKAVIQWLAASQALRPFISYYTCKNKSLGSLEQVPFFDASL